MSVERRVGDRDRSPAARDESPGSDRVGPTRRPPPRVARSGRSRPPAGRSVGVPCDPEVRRPCPRARRLPSRTRSRTCPTTEPEPAGTSYPTRTSTGERGRSHRRAEEARRTTVRAVTSAASNPTTASGVAVRGRRLRRSTRARDARGPTRERGRRGRTDARWPKRRVRPSGAGHTTRSSTCVVGVIGVASPGPRVMGGSGRESPSRTVPISSPPLPSTSRRGFRGSPLHRVPGFDSGRRPGVRERVDPETTPRETNGRDEEGLRSVVKRYFVSAPGRRCGWQPVSSRCRPARGSASTPPGAPDGQLRCRPLGERVPGSSAVREILVEVATRDNISSIRMCSNGIGSDRPSRGVFVSDRRAGVRRGWTLM